MATQQFRHMGPFDNCDFPQYPGVSQALIEVISRHVWVG